MRRDITIVGGGAAGVLVALHLLRQASAPLQLTIVEPRERLAEGVAYSTQDAEHLLNVPAIGMSAHSDDPEHFVKWVGCEPHDFVARHRYADYLRHELTRLTNETPTTEVHHLRDSATSISTTPLGVHTMHGATIDADTVVLALGNAAPTKPDWLSTISATRVIDDPWTHGALDAIRDGSNVLCVGSGLTFVDVALTLTRRGCRVTGVSRHGLLPHVHAPASTLAPMPSTIASAVPAGFGSPVQVSRWLRTQADWRAALTAIRPRTQAIWESFSEVQQSSFLRHARRYWDVHRHRMSKEVADRLHTAQRDGTIRVLGGDARALASESRWDAIILCTGPDDAALLKEAPLQSLASDGHVCIGPHGMGIDTVPNTGQVRDHAGRTPHQIYAIGPLRRGTLWESTAIPEIRSEAEKLALRLLA
jgi:uncharacterized NAD(P)/FAD-binding protein YdhS